MTGQGPISRAVTEALKSGDHVAQDTATEALIKRYAALIDAATYASKYREPLRTIRGALEDHPRAQDALDKIEDALAAHTVASDLGPKLLAALTAQGMTAAGRGAKGGGSGDSGAPAATPAAGALGKLRAVPPTGRVG